MKSYVTYDKNGKARSTYFETEDKNNRIDFSKPCLIFSKVSDCVAIEWKGDIVIVHEEHTTRSGRMTFKIGTYTLHEGYESGKIIINRL